MLRKLLKVILAVFLIIIFLLFLKITQISSCQYKCNKNNLSCDTLAWGCGRYSCIESCANLSGPCFYIRDDTIPTCLGLWNILWVINPVSYLLQ